MHRPLLWPIASLKSRSHHSRPIPVIV
jgi:hypothetical protein